MGSLVDRNRGCQGRNKLDLLTFPSWGPRLADTRLWGWGGAAREGGAWAGHATEGRPDVRRGEPQQSELSFKLLNSFFNIVTEAMHTPAQYLCYPSAVLFSGHLSP